MPTGTGTIMITATSTGVIRKSRRATGPRLGDRAARAAKDRPGRHDEGYYGAPGPGPTRRAATGQGQGSRSFAALTRRRPG